VARGQVRERAILDATIGLLGEVGYAALTMDAVAARAHASKNTIYRRWRSKAALVKAALDAMDAAEVARVPDTGGLRADLLAVVRATCARMDERYMVMMSGLIHAMRVDAELGDALRTHVADETLGPIQVVVDRAVGRGEVSADAPVTLAHQVAEGQILRRTLLGEPLDEDFQAHLVDDLLVPVLTRAFADDRSTA
jgi:AcrR family transcriptional regulator